MATSIPGQGISAYKAPDSTLSNDSKNAVQNKVVTANITNLQNNLSDLEENIVLVQTTQPVSEENQIWVKPDNSEVEIITTDDIDEVVKVSGTQPTSKFNKVWIRDQGEDEYTVPLESEVEEIREDVEELNNAITHLNRQLSDDKGLIFSGPAEAGTTLFTSEDVTPGEILYASLTPTTTSASYVELFDENDNRLGLFGKVSSYYGTRTNIGVIVIPEGFSVAKLSGYSATVDYIQKNFPAEFEKEVYDSLYGMHRNLLDGVSYQKKKMLRIQTGEVEDYNAGFLSGNIPVVPKSKITVDFSLGSSCYGCGFYDANLNFVNGVVSSNNNYEFYVPDGAFFAQFSVTQAIINAGPHAWVTPPSEAEAEKALDAVNPYKRHAIHQYGTRLNGYMHVAFPRMCFFGGRTIVGYRAGYQHMPRTDNTRPGVWQFDAREADGTWVHIKSFSTSDFTGVTGDARDLYIQPTRDGAYLLLVGGFSHYVSGEVFYDCVVAVLNSELNIIDYKTFLNNNDYFYGNPLVTPNGHIIFTSFNKSLKETYIYRSETVFSGTVSDLAFAKNTAITENINHSECCLGYFNDKLVLIQRYENTSAAKMMVTFDLEGLSGWNTPSSLHISIHSPLLLPYYTGKYLPCVGSRSLSSEIQDRHPYLYYLDVTNSTPVAYGDIDPNLITAYNGYPTFLSLGGEKYAIAYYQECHAGTNVDYTRACAGIYYKWVNAREICSQMVYLDV